MAEKLLDGIKVKEDVKAKDLAAEVPDINVYTQEAEKTKSELKHPAECNQESMEPDMSRIAEETPQNIVEKLKKPRKPRQKKNKMHSTPTEQALKMQPANINKALFTADEKIETESIQDLSTSGINPPQEMEPVTPSTERDDIPEVELNQDLTAPVLPVNAEVTAQNILENPKKSRQKKNKINSSLTEPALQMQPANINKALSKADKKNDIEFTQQPSTSKINPPQKVEHRIPSAERDVPKVNFKQDLMTPVPPIIAEVTAQNIPEKQKKPRRPRQKKNKSNSSPIEEALQMQPANNNIATSCIDVKVQFGSIQETDPSCKMYPTQEINPIIISANPDIPEPQFNQDQKVKVLSAVTEEITTPILGKLTKQKKSKQKKTKLSTTEQTLKLQPAKIDKTLSSVNDEFQHEFVQDPKKAECKIFPPKTKRPLTASRERNVPEENPNQDPMAQNQPVIAEEITDDILGKLKNPKKPKKSKNKKNNSVTCAQALQIQVADNKKALSSAEEMQMHVIQEPSSSKNLIQKLIKTLTPSVERGKKKSFLYSVTQALPVIPEETSADILEKPKKQRKPRQKKKKNTSSTALQMQPANKTLEDAKTIVYTTNDMKQIGEKGQQTNNICDVGDPKEPGLEKYIENKTTTEIVARPQTSKDTMQETGDNAEGVAQTPVQMCYLPTEAEGHDDEKPQTSKNALKESNRKGKGRAVTKVQSHLLFFREFYDHNGRLNVRNSDEEKLYIDALYSQVKLACLDPKIKNKIEEAIHSIINDIIRDFKDFRVPIHKVELILNRMHNILFLRLYEIGLTELASFEVRNILTIYRTHYNRAQDIRFLYALL